MSDLLRLVLANALRGGRRTAIAVLSLSLGLFLHVFIRALMDNWSTTTAELPGSERRLIVRHRLSLETPLPEAHGQAIAAIPGVSVVNANHWFGGKLQGHEKDFLSSFAVDNETFAATWTDARVRPEVLARWKKERRAALAGRKLFERLHWRVGQRITLVGDLYAGCAPELEVVGTYEGGRDEETIFFGRRYLQELLKGTQAYGTVGTFSVVISDPARSASVIAAIDRRFGASIAPTKTESERDFYLRFMALMGDVRGTIGKVSAASTFVVFLIVANAMAMAVRERTREIAVLKAIGFGPGLVVGIVVGEGVLVAAVAWGAGAVGARVLFASVLGRPTILGYFSNFAPSWETVLLALPLALAIGVLSAAAPAAFAARLSVLAGLTRLG